ncbi:hypothetical protein KP509_30G032000 [Ceratopteris richardii]|uniref:F-box domain-containing protein n=1 Tax=Ceratopteris richardii TaxID=49495 RepID=A0A8T2R2T3_CERRI|nr:hypothetical protein KP509_30G032000 [Ceratopteris richardii]
MANRGRTTTNRKQRQDANGEAEPKHPKCNGKQVRRKEEKRRNKEEVGSWGCLPPEVAQGILLRLPQHHIPNAVAVSRRWRDFLRHHSRPTEVSESLSPVFICRSWWGYDAASSRWVRYPNLAFLPFHIARVHSSHRGLLLVEAADTEPASALYVCNLSTQIHSQLPSFSLLDPIVEDFEAPSCVEWCHCHLEVEGSESDIAAGEHSFRVIGLLKNERNSSKWPEIVCFDSRQRKWSLMQTEASSLTSAELSNRFIPLLGRSIRLQVSPNRSMGPIYVIASGKNCGWYNYLLKYDPLTSIWLSVQKVPHVSVEIVSYGDTLMAIAIDPLRRQILLYRLAVEQPEQYQHSEGGKECLVLQARSGPDLADFVDACILHSWFTSSVCSPSSRPRLYVGIRLSQEAIFRNTHNQHKQHPLLVEYDGYLGSWRSVSLPKDLLDLQKYSLCSNDGGAVYGDAYHELGLITMPQTFN